MRAIVVGAGGTTRELLRRLGERWDVVVIDEDEATLDLAAGIRAFEPVVGDGSSHLVLKRAGLEDADALVAASHDDDVNLEAIRLAQETGLLRIVGVAAHPERAAEYRALDVPVFSPNSLASRNVEVILEPRRVASTAFAEGKAEAIEFHVSPDSPVRGKALRDLHSESWVVAAVLRNHRLIIPHGHTRLETGDRVTIVGSAADFSTIVSTFTSGESRFPLNFGRRVAVALESADDLDGTVAEALSLVRNSQGESLLLVHRDPGSVRDPDLSAEVVALLEEVEARAEGVEVEMRPATTSPSAAIAQLAKEESVGVVTLPAPQGGDVIGRFRTAKLIRDYGQLGVPLLVSRGTHPYTSLLVPARRTASGEAAARAAIDIAYASGGTVHGAAVVPPAFVSGSQDVDDARRAVAWLREEAAVQGVSVRRALKRGNPVRVIEDLAASVSLLVIAMPDPDASLVVRPGIGGHLVRRAPCSVLLVPARS